MAVPETHRATNQGFQAHDTAPSLPWSRNLVNITLYEGLGFVFLFSLFRRLSLTQNSPPLVVAFFILGQLPLVWFCSSLLCSSKYLGMSNLVSEHGDREGIIGHGDREKIILIPTQTNFHRQVAAENIRAGHSWSLQRLFRAHTWNMLGKQWSIFSPPKSTVQGFSSQAWDGGQTVSIMKPPFAPSLQGGATVKASATKHTDLWLSKVELCYGVGGKFDKASVCFEGEPVALNKSEAVLSSSHGLCSENIRYRGNDLVIFYGCSKKMLGAENVFDKMHMRTFAYWNSIVSTHMCDSDANSARMLCATMEEYIYLLKLVIAATTQNTAGVQGMDSVPGNYVVEQLKLVFLNMLVYVVKTNMSLFLVERTQVWYWWFDRGKSKDINAGSQAATIQGLCSYSSLAGNLAATIQGLCSYSSLEDKTGFEGAALLGPKVEIGLTAHGKSRAKKETHEPGADGVLTQEGRGVGLNCVYTCLGGKIS